MCNSISFTVPTGITVVNDTTGKTVSGGSTAKIYAGETFHLEAPLSYTGTFDSGAITGGLWDFKAYKGTHSTYQDVSSFYWADNKTTTVRITANFNGQILLRVGKKSANPEMTNGNVGNDCYDLNGAVYGVYTDADCTKPLKVNNKEVTITVDTVDSDGNYYGEYYPAPMGDYYCKEITPPKGYLLDDKAYPLKPTGNTSKGYPIYRSYNEDTGRFIILEQSDSDPVAVLLRKISQSGETGERLAEAQYAVKYYAGIYYNEAALKDLQPEATWYFRTDNDGWVKFDEEHLDPNVQSSEFYYDVVVGVPAIPIGTISIEETEAPPGFIKNDELFIAQMTGTGGSSTSQFNYPTFEEPEVSISTSASVNSVFESTTSTITDTVYYTLEPNTDYTVTGWLVKKSSGAVVPLTGSDGTMSNNKVTKSFTTTADGNGSVQIKYNFNSTGYGGETVVAFADVRNSDGTVIGEHKDINSTEQSIQFKPPGIATSAICYNSDSRYIYPYDDVYITDTISFENLVGDTYTITPRAMLISKDGKSVEKEIPITLDSTNVKALSGNGSVDVEFTISSAEFLKLVGNDVSRLSELNGRTIVIYETLTGANGNTFKHEDMNDIAQTLTMITPTVTTKATDSVSKLHQAYASKSTTIYDEVTVDGLVPGEEYGITGFIFVEGSGSPSVSSENYYIATAKTQTFKVSYTFDSTPYAGRKIYCSAYLYAPDGLTQVAIHIGKNDTAQQVEFLSPTISTTANAPSTDSQYAYGVSDLQIDDTVNLKGLIPNEAYSVIGQLVDKSTGKVLTTSTEYITANGAAQNVNMSFKLNASGYSGKDVVVYETLYYKGQIVAEHKNINDTAQTITLLNPTISTKASGKTSISDNSEIKDTVTITGLIPGKEYTLDGQLIDKATTNPIELISVTSGNNEVVLSENKTTVTVTFTSKTESQTLDISYKFNSRHYAGKEVVVFERLSYKGDVIATHNDLNDVDQTIKYKDEGDLYLRKYDTYTGNNLQGAVFNLYKVNEDDTETLMENCFNTRISANLGEYHFSSMGSTNLEPFRYIPGASISEEEYGTMIVKELPSGTYVLKEKKAPSGYMVDIADGVTFEITPGETTELEIGNSPAIIPLELIKTDDSDAANRIANVGFTLYTDKNCTVTAKDFYGKAVGEVKTDESGYLVFDCIKYSLTAETSYYLKETTTPSGYAPLDYVIRVSIDTDGNVTYYKVTDNGDSQITDTVARTTVGGEVDITRIINKSLGSITVYKKSATDKTPLEGVLMNLSDSDGNILRFSKNTNGEYVLDENGQTDIVTDKDGKAVMSGLLYGTYYVSEIKTLSNYYLLADKVEIYLDSENVSQTIYNTPKANFPNAGGFDKMLWLLSGGAVAVFGSVLLIITIKKKRKEDSKMQMLKKYSKNFLSLFIVTLTLVSMLCVGVIGAGAANPYHINFDKTGSIEFWKYEMEDDAIQNATTPGDGELKELPEGATPLEGVEFTIYQIYTKAQLADFFTEDGKELPTPTEAEAMISSVPANRIQKKTTASNGYIKFDNLELGIYFVKETFSPSQVRQETAPFVVAVPSTNAAGTDWLYDLTVQPKNQTKYTSVTLHKTAVSTDTAKNGKDLAGFTFSLEEKITTINSATGVTTDTWTPVATTGSVGTTGGKAPVAATWTTGANGKFTIDHLATAREYRFKELSATDKQYIVDSTVYYYFRTNADGTINYAGRVTPGDTITYPTATVADNTIGVTNETPEVHKYVSVDTTDVSEKTWHQDVTQDINKTVYWKVAADIPEIIEKLSTYKIIDTLSKGLTYDSSANNKDTQVYVEIDGAAISKNDYTVTSAKNSTTGETVITVSVTNMSVLAGHTTCNVIFTTTLNEDAVIGGDNPNEARLEYTNDVGTDSTYYKDTEEPEVHTGGYTWYKKSSDMNAPLANAKFKVYRSEADAKSNTNAIEFAKGADGKYYMVNDGEGDAVVVSGADGYVTVLGLLYGSDDLKSNEGSTDYWVSEIEAPKGYNLLQAPFKITVTATSHNYASNANVDVVNTPEAEFPLTGGQAAMLFGIGGAVVIGIGAIVFLKKRKNDDSKCGEK
ncbi:MAG: SpaH/EbpB family LPXTG-anchored major pilin [Acutalibacteraceae bacterium]